MPGRAWARYAHSGPLESGDPIAEDWTWKGSPDSVPLWNDYLLNQPGAPVPGVDVHRGVHRLAGPVRAQPGHPLAGLVHQPEPCRAHRRLSGSPRPMADQQPGVPDSDSAYAHQPGAHHAGQPWQDLLDAQQAELGRLWVDRDGRLVVRARAACCPDRSAAPCPTCTTKR